MFLLDRQKWSYLIKWKATNVKMCKLCFINSSNLMDITQDEL